MFEDMQAQITLSYNQLCVFDPSLERPYNDWNAAQTAQGFSWRPGSVSFVTDAADALVTIDVERALEAPQMGRASTLIRVPFDVPPSGLVEVGSIMSGVEVSLPAGSYALYFVHPLNPGEPFILRFVPSDRVQAAVLKESGTAKAQESYDMQASAA